MFHNSGHIKVLSTLLLCAFFMQACKDKNKGKVNPGDSYDKSGMLNNIGSQLAMPAYANLKLSIDTLQTAATAFTTSPSQQGLLALQTAFTATSVRYQWCSTFELGPAESEILRASFNTFPCDTTQINSNISSGSYDLSSAANIDAKGLPALDYLLYKNNALNLFTVSPNAVNAKKYLNDIVAEMATKSTKVNNAWVATSGNYIKTFSENTGSDAGGSIGQLVNQLNYDFELLKNIKIAIPLGKRTLGTPLPDKTEAYYSGLSLTLVTEQLNSIENIYLGRDKAGKDGLGLDDYLDHIGANNGSGSLNSAIKARFAAIKSKLNALQGPLSTAVVNNNAAVDAIYADMQQMVVLMKVDMPSALGVLITYQDNDGD